MHRLSAFTSTRCVAVAFALTVTACADGGSSPSGDESDDSPIGRVEHDPEDAPSDDALTFEEVNTSVDVTRDEDLPKLEGHGFSLIDEVVLPGRKVAFYEADDGSTFHMEIGRSNAARRLPGERSLRGSALYEFLTHRRPPKRLLDAEERAGIHHEAPLPQAEATHEKGGTGTVYYCGIQGGCPWTRDEFRAEYCRPTDRYYERLNVSRDTWLRLEGAEYIKVGLFTTAGAVRYEARWVDEPFNDQLVYLWMLVKTGYYVAWQREDTWAQADVWTAGSEADGDRYDHCANYHF